MTKPVILRVDGVSDLVEQYNKYHGKDGRFTSGAVSGGVYVPRKGSRGYRLDEYQGQVGPSVPMKTPKLDQKDPVSSSKPKMKVRDMSFPKGPKGVWTEDQKRDVYRRTAIFDRSKLYFNGVTGVVSYEEKGVARALQAPTIDKWKKYLKTAGFEEIVGSRGIGNKVSISFRVPGFQTTAD
jgi:hypothetical protein